jgi:enterochelin esterase family protein
METEIYETLALNRHPSSPLKGRGQREGQLSKVDMGDRQYHPCPEAYPADDVPSGDVLHIKDWSESKVFADTTRDIWIYTPHNLDESSAPPSLALFNDGAGYLSRQGAVRATNVLDRLIHDEEIPPTVGVFVNPGQSTRSSDDAPAYGQRSFEYDSVTPDFVNFVDQEILPLVIDHIARPLNEDPAQRLIGGISSGGICAFNAAWHSPKSFGLVLSHCGSFTNIRGGHNFPYLIRSSEKKPIRTFLQSGKQDLNIVPGNWAIANHDVASALEFSGYDYQFVFGEGGHSLQHGGAIFADSLRWLFNRVTDR